MILIITVFSMAPPNMGKFDDDGLKDVAVTVDSALAQWYQFHSGSYPADLNALITAGVIPATTPVDKLTYSTAAGNTQYRLSVTLRASTWATPGSKY